MRRVAIYAAAVVAATDIAYVIQANSQGAGYPLAWRVPFIAAFIGLLAVSAALAGLRFAEPWRTPLMVFGGTGAVSMGILGAASFGLLLVPVGVILLVVGLNGDRSRPHQYVGAAVAAGLAAVILVTGMQVTELAIACPPTGGSTGSGSALITGPYHYTCLNGRLTMAPGVCNSGSESSDAHGNVTSVSAC